jgi:hypothetical protein
MKLLLASLLVMSVTVGSAQDNVTRYSGVVQVDSSKSKDILFSRAKQWIAENYNSAKTVVQNEDKEAGTITLKAGFPYMQVVPLAKFDAFMHYSMTLSFKDGRFKYDVSNFYPECANVNYPYMTEDPEPNKQFRDAFGKKGWGKTKEVISEKMPKLIDSLVGYIKIDKAKDW